MIKKLDDQMNLNFTVLLQYTSIYDLIESILYEIFKVVRFLWIFVL